MTQKIIKHNKIENYNKYNQSKIQSSHQIVTNPIKPIIAWINPLMHPVYNGWLGLFEKLGTLKVYSLMDGTSQFAQEKLPAKKTIQIVNTNFTLTKKSQTIEILNSLASDNKKVVPVIGDIFSNSLCWTYRSNRAIYYTEFFLSRGKIQRLIFALSAWWFWNTKIMVPSKQSQKAMSRITKKTLYLPQLTLQKIRKNPTTTQSKKKVLFVGNSDDWKKNVKYLLEELLPLSDVEVSICGRDWGWPQFAQYKKKYGSRLKFIAPVNHNDLYKIYTAHNIFVLPSIVDPIGAVTLEAMTCSMPIVISKYCGSASYVQENKNGKIFDPSNSGALREIINNLTFTQIKKMSNTSAQIVWDDHSLNNPKLVKRLSTQFRQFAQLN